MDHRIAAVALAPVLLLQGLHVRWRTPRLPEPPGPRRGSGGEGKPLRLLIVGDSSAAGVGAHTQGAALSGQLAARLTRHFHLSWRLVARTGDGVRDVLAHIESVPREDFDVAIVAVGVNDVTAVTSARHWRDSLGHLCERLQARFKTRRVLLSPLPPMHAFPALPQPLRWYLGKRAASLNQAMHTVTADNVDWVCVEPEFPLKKEYMAADGFHPGPRAYSLWAEKMAMAIKPYWLEHMPDSAVQPDVT